MVSPQEYDLIKCCLSQGLLEKFLTLEEKKEFGIEDENGELTYGLPSELLLEFLEARERYFEQVFGKLKNKKIIILEKSAGQTITCDDILIGIQNGKKIKRVPIRKFLSSLNFTR